MRAITVILLLVLSGCSGTANGGHQYEPPKSTPWSEGTS